MKTRSVRTYTVEFREAAVSQVLVGGRGVREVARSLEISAGTLRNWVDKRRKGQALLKRPSAMSELGGAAPGAWRAAPWRAAP